jgi:hypothetical protein
MELETCRGYEGHTLQYDEPTWEPLVDAVGHHLAGGFMWMQEHQLETGSVVHVVDLDGWEPADAAALRDAVTRAVPGV